jgi:hypothetical protein
MKKTVCILTNTSERLGHVAAALPRREGLLGGETKKRVTEKGSVDLDDICLKRYNIWRKRCNVSAISLSFTCRGEACGEPSQTKHI